MAGSMRIVDVSCIDGRDLWRGGNSEVSEGDGGRDSPLSISISPSEVGLVDNWGPVMMNRPLLFVRTRLT